MNTHLTINTFNEFQKYSLQLTKYFESALKISLLLCLPFISSAQVSYEGTVVNKSSKISVPFATISLYKANKGTNTDEQGRFILISSKFEHDTLIVSSVGYETIKIPVEIFIQNMEIQLAENEFTLKDIIIIGNYDKSKWLNDYSNCGYDWFIGTGLIRMLAQHFRSPSQNSMLKEIELCKFNGNSIFRIRVFNMDSVSRKPSTEFVDTLIEIKTKSKHVNINLEKYKIIIPDRDFFIAVEWLYIPYNESRVKLNIGGQKIVHSEFAPSLSIKYHKKKISDNEHFMEAWQMDFRGKWNLIPGNMQLVMAAKVKFNER